MKNTITRLFLATLFLFSNNLRAEDTLELETTFIKGNKEMPQILYVVPWKDIKKSKREAQYLILHSLFGDLFDPVNADKDQVGTTR